MEKEINEYDKQADDFLKETGTEFKAVFLKNGTHFIGETDKRDIWKITLKKGNKKITFNFGNSLNDSKTHLEPKPYDILAGLTKYPPEDLGEFCDEYGYNIEDKNTKKIYKAVCKEWEKVSSLYNEEELNKLRDIN